MQVTAPDKISQWLWLTIDGYKLAYNIELTVGEDDTFSAVMADKTTDSGKIYEVTSNAADSTTNW